MIRLLLCLFCLSAPATLFAQTYQVNLVVFENLGGSSGEAVDQPKGVRFEPSLDAVDLDALPDDGNGSGFQRADISNPEFSAVVSSLRKSARYKVLLATSWRQPGLADGEALQVLLHGGQQYGQHFQLEGTVRLTRADHLQVEADLWLGEFVPTDTPPADARESSVILADGSRIEPPTRWYEPVRLIRMQDFRRLATKKLYYLDHPVLGAIIQVTRIR